MNSCKSTWSAKSASWTRTTCCTRSTPRAITTRRAISTRSHAAVTVDQFGGRFHQSAGARHRGARDQTREERPLRAAAGLRSDAWARHAHLGRRVAAVPERTARLERVRKSRRLRISTKLSARLGGTSAPRGRFSRRRFRCISALRSLASIARECPRGNSRDRCTGPKRTRISRLTMMPRARPPVAHLRRARRTHRDVEPVIEARAVLRFGLRGCSSARLRNPRRREIPRPMPRSAGRACAARSRR